MEFIDLKYQYQLYKNDIDKAISEVIESAHFIMGPQVERLEQQLREFVGVKHAITCASGTDSLLMALMALGIGPGDEVITVPFTWIATAEVIGVLNATPVFVDIEPSTFNIDVDKIERAITARTKAIIPVSLFGQMPNYSKINEICTRHAITVIEDGAQSFGATQFGKRSCGVTSIGSTSFFPAKPLGCFGDGGALFTDDDAIANKLRAIRSHGGEKRHFHPYIGINGRMDTIQCAIVLEKFKHFSDELEKRAAIGARYSSLLKNSCVVPVIQPGNTHVYAQYTIRTEKREMVASILKQHGIPTAVYYPRCLHQQPAFSKFGYKIGDFPVSERAAQEVISLPMHPFLSESDQDSIIACLIKALS